MNMQMNNSTVGAHLVGEGVTVFTAVDNSGLPTPAGKSLSLTQDGSLQKKSTAPPVYIGQSRPVTTVDDLEKVLAGMNGTQILVSGVVTGAPELFQFVSKRAAEKLGMPPASDTPEWFSITTGERTYYTAIWKARYFAPSPLMLLEFDLKDSMPAGMSPPSVQSWWATLAVVCPALVQVRHLMVPSSSSRVMSGTGQALKPQGGIHGWVKVADPEDIPRAVRVLHKRLVLAGYAWPEVKVKNGVEHRTTYSFIDPSVAAPGRKVFAGPPALEDGLQLLPFVHELDGTVPVLDTRLACPDLSAEDERRYAELTRTTYRRNSHGGGCANTHLSGQDFYMDDTLERADGTMYTVAELVNGQDDHVRLQADWRSDDGHESAFFQRKADGAAFIIDQYGPTQHQIVRMNRPRTAEPQSAHAVHTVVSSIPERPQSATAPVAFVRTDEGEEDDWANLRRCEFAEISWLIEQLLPPGVSLLVGRPKQGKSWLALAWCMLVATGRPAFGKKTSRAKALYLGLEDSRKRLQNRIEKLKKAHDITDTELDGYLKTKTKAPRIGEGFVRYLRDRLQKDADLRLVVVDVLAKVRQPRQRTQSVYEADYAMGESIKVLSAEFPPVAFLIVHHANKRGEDALDAVSGTNGLAGGVDNIYSMMHGDSGHMELHINGRDIEESDTIIMPKGPDGMWTMQSRDSAADACRSATREKIREAMRDGAVSPKDIRAATEFSETAVNAQLYRMKQQGEVVKTGYGKYGIAGSSARPEKHAAENPASVAAKNQPDCLL